MIQLTRQPIDAAALVAQVQLPAAGAVVLFLGTVRQFTDQRQTVSLDYEGYEAMALGKLAELEAEARRRWPIVECALVHRLGHLELAEASVAVAVSTGHRQAAFEAGKWLIDTLKEVVPIWKKENWADGTTQWVHPGLPSPESSSPQSTSPQTSSPQSTSPESTSPESTSPEATSPESTSPESTSPESAPSSPSRLPH